MTREAEGAPWQVLLDCVHCRTEGAVLELFDPRHPATRFGVPTDRRCRLCGWHEVAAPMVPAEGGCPGCGAEAGPSEGDGPMRCARCGFAPQVVTASPPADLTDAARAREALARWAEEDGEPDLEVFCAGGFGGSVDEVVAKLAAAEPVPTMFDVVAFLFPSASGAPVQRAVERPGDVFGEGSGGAGPAPGRPEPPRLGPDPALGGRLLASVMAADGAVRASERRFVDGFLQQAGLAALAAADLRVWRPAEVGPAPPPELRDRLLEAAVHLMHVDRERDPSEWRVIRTFASAWGATDAQLAAWDRQYERRYGSTARRLGRALNRLLGGDDGG